MKSSALFRSSILLGLWLFLTLAVHAGTVNTVFVPDLQDPARTDDDVLVQMPLHWYDLKSMGRQLTFYYACNLDGTILPQQMPLNPRLSPSPNADGTGNDPIDLRAAFGRVMHRWNQAQFASARPFTLSESVLPVTMAPPNPNLPQNTGYDYPAYPTQVMLDGYNVIDFLSGVVSGGGQGAQLATTFISYFEQDFPIATWSANGGFPQNVLAQITNDPNGAQVINATLSIQIDQNDPASNLVINLPLRDFKKGEIFDTDIGFDSDPSAYYYYRAWGDTIASVPQQYRSELTTTYDIDMVLMHEMGWAQGLSNSMLFDSVMYPYYNIITPLGTPMFVTDQFRKRLLSFDDELTAGIAWGATFPSTTGAIAGQVLDGNVVGSQMQINQGLTTGQTGQPQPQATPQPTPVPQPNATTNVVLAANPYVMQVPVCIGVNNSQLPAVPQLTLGRLDTAQAHPDNVPWQLTPTSPVGRGPWRLMAHVMTGQGIAIPADAGFLYTIGGSTGTNGQPDPAGAGDGGLVDPTLLTSLNRFNSNYLIPGLPPRDSNNQPVNYAVYLPHDIGFEGTPAVTVVGDYPFNPFQTMITGQVAPTATNYDYVNEFYGGVDANFQFGSGNAPITVNPADDLFMNNYIIGEMDLDGRFAASINQGPTLLSGYNIGPRSFVTIKGDGYAFSNKTQAIGYVVDPVVVTDPQVAGGQPVTGTSGAGAIGSWQQPGKFKIQTQMKPSAGGGLVGIPAGIEVIHTVTNLSNSATTISLRQILDADVFNRENPVYVVGGKILNNSRSYRGSQIPREILFESSSSTETAIRGFVDLTGGTNTTPSWVTIGTLGELTTLLNGDGASLRDVNSISKDSGIALGWSFRLTPGQQQIIRFIVGYYPGGTLHDSWVPWTDPLPVGTVRNAAEDDPNAVTPVNVQAGKVSDGIDIITNAAAGTYGYLQPVPEGSATGVLQFIRQANGFTDVTGTQEDVNAVLMGGAVGDIDNDGDLDIVTCSSNFSSQNAQNKIYLNEQRINADGSVTRYFRNVTLGEDVNSDADDRLQPLHRGADCWGVTLADFDDDGWLEIVFTNHSTAQNQPSLLYYDNLGPEKPGYFQENPDVMPALLNGSTTLSPDYPFRAAAGDIDSDGDIDLIVSQYEPFFYYDSSNIYGLGAWVDHLEGNPKTGDGRMHNSQDHYADTLFYTERVLVNYKYTPKWAANFNLDQRRVITDPLGTYFVDETWGSDDKPGTLTSLVTHRDPASGALERQVVDSWDPSEIDRMAPAFPNLFSVNDQGVSGSDYTSSMGISAVEPHLGNLFGGAGLDLLSVRALSYAGVGSFSVELPFCKAPTPAITGVPFIAISAVTGYDPNVTYGRDSAVFRNLDLFSNSLSLDPAYAEVVGDGVPDGYFGCENYGMDYGLTGQQIIKAGSDGNYISTDGGLFVYERDTLASSTQALFRYDAFPLFIGIPDDFSAEETAVPTGWSESNVMDSLPNVTGRDGSSHTPEVYCGLIGDWQNRNRPQPLLLPDALNTNTGYVFGVSDLGTRYPLSGTGISRNYDVNGPIGIYGGIATQYFDTPNYAYAYTLNTTAGVQWPTMSFPRSVVGQPYGAASADFDLDGDMDLFVVCAATNGYNWGTPGPKAPKEVFVNDSFANFTTAQNALLPNPPANGMGAAAADIDNDGDPDLIAFNGFGPNDLYINQAVTRPPDPLNAKDPTMFYDGTIWTIPNIYGPSFTGNEASFSQFGFHGATVGAQVVDLNMDGRPDLVLAEGGKMSHIGSFARVLINGGKPAGEGTIVYKPGGAAYPAPRADLWIHNLIPSQGFYNDLYYYDPLRPDVKYWDYVQRPADHAFFLYGAYSYLPPYLEGYLGSKIGALNDVIAGDVDKDGDPDLLLIHYGGADDGSMATGPQVVLNTDSDDPVLNTIPDKNSLGDAVFYPAPDITLVDPGNTGAKPNVVMKNQGQKAKFADFNGDNYPDVVIANGYGDDMQGRGAPNVLLMNTKVNARFADVTETNLPTVTQAGITQGVMDNTLDVVVGDFDGDGDVDIIFGNQSTANAPQGFRLMLNDGTGHFTDAPAGKLPAFTGRKVCGMAVADIDGLGEPTEDKNHNGILDPGEDTNGNGVIDWLDLPSEWVDLNNNGKVDPGETTDLNGDGIITVRHDGVWDGSLDVVVSFDNDIPAVLINNFNNLNSAKTALIGGFTEEASSRLIGVKAGPNRGLDIGDINLDGYPDIVIAQYIGGVVRPVTVWLNQPKISGSKVQWGFFKDISYEVPYPRGVGFYDEVTNGRAGVPDDTSFTGWANDVKLVDFDGDGDLDMFVSTLAAPNQTDIVGALDMMYVNRTIGDGFNFKGYAAQARNGNPNVFNVAPRGAKRGTVQTVTVVGENLKPSTRFSFGSGVTVTGVSPVNANTVTLTLTVATDAAVGPRSVLVQNPSGSTAASKTGMFYVYDKVLNEVPNRTWSLYE